MDVTSIQGLSVATLSSMIKLDTDHYGAFLVSENVEISNLLLVIVVDDDI